MDPVLENFSPSRKLRHVMPKGLSQANLNGMGCLLPFARQVLSISAKPGVMKSEDTITALAFPKTSEDRAGYP